MSNTGPDSARDPHGISKTVEVGEFRLDIGAPTGMAISLAPEAVAQKDNQADLTAALAQEDRDDEDQHGAVAKIDDASRKSDDITTQVERADSLWIGLATDRLSVSAVNNEIDTLLAVLQRLDQAGHFDDQLRLARALSRCWRSHCAGSTCFAPCGRCWRLPSTAGMGTLRRGPCTSSGRYVSPRETLSAPMMH